MSIVTLLIVINSLFFRNHLNALALPSFFHNDAENFYMESLESQESFSFRKRKGLSLEQDEDSLLKRQKEMKSQDEEMDFDKNDRLSFRKRQRDGAEKDDEGSLLKKIKEEEENAEEMDSFNSKEDENIQEMSPEEQNFICRVSQMIQALEDGQFQAIYEGQFFYENQSEKMPSGKLLTQETLELLFVVSRKASAESLKDYIIWLTKEDEKIDMEGLIENKQTFEMYLLANKDKKMDSNEVVEKKTILEDYLRIKFIETFVQIDTQWSDKVSEKKDIGLGKDPFFEGDSSFSQIVCDMWVNEQIDLGNKSDLEKIFGISLTLEESHQLLKIIKKVFVNRQFVERYEEWINEFGIHWKNKQKSEKNNVCLIKELYFLCIQIDLIKGNSQCELENHFKEVCLIEIDLSSEKEQLLKTQKKIIQNMRDIITNKKECLKIWEKSLFNAYRFSSSVNQGNEEYESRIENQMKKYELYGKIIHQVIHLTSHQSDTARLSNQNFLNQVKEILEKSVFLLILSKHNMKVIYSDISTINPTLCYEGRVSTLTTFILDFQFEISTLSMMRLFRSVPNQLELEASQFLQERGQFFSQTFGEVFQYDPFEDYDKRMMQQCQCIHWYFRLQKEGALFFKTVSTKKNAQDLGISQKKDKELKIVKKTILFHMFFYDREDLDNQKIIEESIKLLLTKELGDNQHQVINKIIEIILDHKMMHCVDVIFKYIPSWYLKKMNQKTKKCLFSLVTLWLQIKDRRDELKHILGGGILNLFTTDILSCNPFYSYLFIYLMAIPLDDNHQRHIVCEKILLDDFILSKNDIFCESSHWIFREIVPQLIHYINQDCPILREGIWNLMSDLCGYEISTKEITESDIQTIVTLILHTIEKIQKEEGSEFSTQRFIFLLRFLYLMSPCFSQDLYHQIFPYLSDKKKGSFFKVFWQPSEIEFLYRQSQTKQDQLYEIFKKEINDERENLEFIDQILPFDLRSLLIYIESLHQSNLSTVIKKNKIRKKVTKLFSFIKLQSQFIKQDSLQIYIDQLLKELEWLESDGISLQKNLIKTLNQFVTNNSESLTIDSLQKICQFQVRELDKLLPQLNNAMKKVIHELIEETLSVTIHHILEKSHKDQRNPQNLLLESVVMIGEFSKKGQLSQFLFEQLLFIFLSKKEIKKVATLLDYVQKNTSLKIPKNDSFYNHLFLGVFWGRVKERENLIFSLAREIVERNSYLYEFFQLSCYLILCYQTDRLDMIEDEFQINPIILKEALEEALESEESSLIAFLYIALNDILIGVLDMNCQKDDSILFLEPQAQMKLFTHLMTVDRLSLNQHSGLLGSYIKKRWVPTLCIHALYFSSFDEEDDFSDYIKKVTAYKEEVCVREFLDYLTQRGLVYPVDAEDAESSLEMIPADIHYHQALVAREFDKNESITLKRVDCQRGIVDNHHLKRMLDQPLVYDAFFSLPHDLYTSLSDKNVCIRKIRYKELEYLEEQQEKLNESTDEMEAELYRHESRKLEKRLLKHYIFRNENLLKDCLLSELMTEFSYEFVQEIIFEILQESQEDNSVLRNLLNVDQANLTLQKMDLNTKEEIDFFQKLIQYYDNKDDSKETMILIENAVFYGRFIPDFNVTVLKGLALDLQKRFFEYLIESKRLFVVFLTREQILYFVEWITASFLDENVYDSICFILRFYLEFLMENVSKGGIDMNSLKVIIINLIREIIQGDIEIATWENCQKELEKRMSYYEIDTLRKKTVELLCHQGEEVSLSKRRKGVFFNSVSLFA